MLPKCPKCNRRMSREDETIDGYKCPYCGNNFSVDYREYYDNKTINDWEKYESMGIYSMDDE